ncbi:hypothetical protein [Candidatus Avelusimicrobium fimicolum]|uniref:hypothetical protein n=1 Tax=Candidatus Avelusimicrobium fimicolum TaxID=3416216 RepID=UPI003D0F3E83
MNEDFAYNINRLDYVSQKIQDNAPLEGLQPFKILKKDKKREIRETYQIPQNEKILFFSTEENERVVITENELIWDDPELDTIYRIPWSKIKKVYYKDEQYIVHTLDDAENAIPTSYFWGSSLDMEKIPASCNRVASILTDTANCVNKTGATL